ncbi:MAG: hypothetical protein RUMPE_00561 [Eubacteriales bacterium SKADARSKE-1]|nr:hypothetical protein [Eubacteriales bacterium SKADARSKE-1]
MAEKNLKSLLSIGVSLCMLLGMFTVGTMAMEPGDSEETPIFIKSKLDFETFAQEVNEGESFEGKYVKLSNDIYLNANDSLNGKPITWNPVGFCFLNENNGKISDNSKSFKGTFDGNGFSIICNIDEFVKNDGTDKTGAIFGYVGKHGVLKNLGIRGIISGEKIQASVSALCDVNCGTLENCKARATVKGVYGASGLAFINCGTIRKCEVNGKILSRDLNCAGICSTNYGEVDSCKVHALLANCQNGGIAGDNNYLTPETGGIASFNYGKITNCFVNSYISNKNIETLKNYEIYLKQKSDGKNAYIGCAGGIVSTNNGLIENCKFTGSVNSYEVGGIVGINYEIVRSCETDCHMMGAIIGGIAAQNILGDKDYSGELVLDHQGGYIANCNSKSDIKSLFLMGDIVCTDYWEDSHATVENCTASSKVVYLQETN